MPWNIGLAGNDFNILNSKINEVNALTYNNIIDFVNYFMITENGNVGINNKNPTEKLDIKGNTIVNGTLLTSNVIGWRIDDTSNILKINYTDDIINNNNLEIYGKSTFKGNIAIGDDNNYSILNINGLVNATEFKGTGSNIINIDADNINKGILNASFGGTGINNIKNEQILYGSNNNTVGQTPGFRFLEASQTLQVAYLKGDGSLVENINARHITSGILSGRYGGTGKASYEIEGGLLVGNIRAPGNSANIDQTINLKWDDNASNLLINGNLKLFGTNKTIFINDEPLGYQHIGPYNVATSEIPGVIKYDGNTFKFNDAGQLILNVSTSSKWEKNEDESIIWYPKYSDPNSVQLECVGIGFIPDENVDRVNRLSVKGNINIKSYTNSPGAYLINGINVDEINSNFLSKKIDDLILDNIKQEYGGVNKRCFDLSYTGTSATYKISGDNRNFYFDNLVEFEKGIRISQGGSIGFQGALTIESLNLTSGTQGVENNPVLKVNQADTGDKSTIAQFEYGGVPKMLLDKQGRLGIGEFNRDNFPKEKLDVQGNIIASGYITSYYSDERLKHFTSRIKNSLEIINNLNGYYYEPNEKALQFGFKHEKQIGLSAQEVTKYIPEITKLAPFDAINDADGNVISKSGESYLTICYERLGPIFVEAIKELTNEIKELKKENIFIKSELERIKLSI